jgi:Protein of unknown function (DUF2924)
MAENESGPPGSVQTIQTLEAAPRPELAGQWQRLYRSQPPKGVSRRFLIAAIAHALQLRAQGRTASSLQRRIERVAAKRCRNPTASPANIPAPGARLIREWNGSTYTVDVTEGGFVWDGVSYRSLSAIARTITGTRWSGPRFFGLPQEKGS